MAEDVIAVQCLEASYKLKALQCATLIALEQVGAIEALILTSETLACVNLLAQLENRSKYRKTESRRCCFPKPWFACDQFQPV